MRYALRLSIILTLSACSAEPADNEPEPLDEAAIFAAIGERAYLRDDFYRVNNRPYETAAAGASINVWVSADGLPGFTLADPDVAGSGANVPEGTIIVREVLADDLRLAKLTVMYKAHAGYNPGGGDFWFAATDVTGTPLVDAGEPLAGPLPARCGSCHLGRATDGYLFGVPGDNRRPGMHP